MTETMITKLRINNKLEKVFVVNVINIQLIFPHK